MPSPSIETHARAIASNLSLGFDPFAIILAFLPEVFKCLAPKTPEELAETLQREYDANGGHYRKGRIKQGAKRLKRIARAQGHELSDDAAEDSVIEVCEYARNRTAKQVQAFGASVGVWPA